LTFYFDDLPFNILKQLPSTLGQQPAADGSHNKETHE
jgi:hypothetical protein